MACVKLMDYQDYTHGKRVELFHVLESVILGECEEYKYPLLKKVRANWLQEFGDMLSGSFWLSPKAKLQNV